MAMLPQLLEHLPALGVIMYHSPLLNYFNGKKSFYDVERYLNALYAVLFCAYPLISARPSADAWLSARVFLLPPCVSLLCRWPSCCKPATLRKLPSWITGTTGPFGDDCYKLVECGVCLLLAWPVLRIGSAPGAAGVAVVLGGSGLVALVLYVWSTLMRSGGTHTGVNAMTASSKSKTLTVQQHAHLASMAFGNALCEELVSRGFHLGLLAAQYGPAAQHADTLSAVALAVRVLTWAPNVCQALSFGIAHWYGVPSGFTGVGLTFVYGLLMGVLHECFGGLLVPVLAHTLADYYIFAVIVRREFED